MRKRGIVSSSCRFLSLALVFAWATTLGFGQQPRMDASHMPTGGWSVAFIPYMGIGNELNDVVVSGVKSELTEGIAVTEIRILNRSQEPLTAVRLSAYFSLQGQEDALLREVRTELYQLPETIEPNEMRRVQFRSPPVSFLEISRPFVRKGILTGDYVVQMAVTEARFQDHSRWTIGSFSRKRHQGLIFAKVASTQIENPCPNQDCVVVEVDGLMGYVCKSGPLGLFCESSGTSCLTEMCGPQRHFPERPPLLL